MEDDDILMSSTSVQNQDEIEVHIDGVSRLQQIITPLKVNELMDDYFLDIIKNNRATIKLNLFIIGYKQDQGIRACGGRSGAELGCQVFRDQVYHRQSALAPQLKSCGFHIYDLGDITKYQLSIYQNNQETEKKHTLSEIINFILVKIENSKIVIIGGSDDVCKAIHEADQIQDIIHIDSMIDAKDKFMLQLQDRNKQGELLFKPSYHEHHTSYLRTLYLHD